MNLRRALPVVLCLVVLAGIGFQTFQRLVILRADMADFLPPGETPAIRLLLDQLSRGAATSLLLVGLEGAPPETLARLSTDLAERLKASGRFSLVANGPASFADADQSFLFGHRYLLAPTSQAAAFEIPALAADLRRLLDQLAGSAAPLAKRFGLADPIGAFTTLIAAWAAQSAVAERAGVWFSGDGGRALLVLRATTGSLDATAGRLALDVLNEAFAAAAPGAARLLVSGPGVFAVAAAEAIRGDVHRLAILSIGLILAFLLWRHRSVYVLAAAAIPLALGVLAGSLAVQLTFGFLHALTLGFGLTMLGVAADYPLLLIGQRAALETTRDAARRIGPTLALAVLSAALGLTAMLFSSFPGLAQLGLFALVGLLTAAAATRWLLPVLVADVAFRGQQVSAGWLKAAAGLRRRRAWLALPTAAAALLLVTEGAPAFETGLAKLSPIPAAARDLDADLRRELGAPDVRHLIAIGGADAQAVLRAAERLDAALAPLIAQGVLDGADLPSRYLPSQETQRARQAALPPPEQLQARLAAAAIGLPFRAEAFARFIADVGAQRLMPPLAPADVTSPALRARLEPLLFAKDDGWYGLAVLRNVHRPNALATAVTALGEPDLVYVDLAAETEQLVQRSTREALRWLLLGGVLLAVLQTLALRRPGPILGVVLPTAGATIITLAVLELLAVRLTLFHLAALLLMIGVAIDYALFLGRRRADADAEARGLGAVLNCCATTLLTFGLLAFSENPVLHGIGLTVAIGVVAAVLLAIALSPRPATPLDA